MSLRSPLVMIGTICLASGLLFLLAEPWVTTSAADEAALVPFSGKVEAARDITHPRQLPGTVTFALNIRDREGALLLADVVKQRLRPDQVRALIGQTVSGRRHGVVIYELDAGAERLFTYSDTARVLRSELAILRNTALTMLIAGLLLLIWARFKELKVLP